MLPPDHPSGSDETIHFPKSVENLVTVFLVLRGLSLWRRAARDELDHALEEMLMHGLWHMLVCFPMLLTMAIDSRWGYARRVAIGLSAFQAALLFVAGVVLEEKPLDRPRIKRFTAVAWPANILLALVGNLIIVLVAKRNPSRRPSDKEHTD